MPRSSYQSFFLLLSCLSLVRCLPAKNPASVFISNICTAPTQHFNALELAIGKDFCTLFLHIKPSTKTVFSSHTIHATAQATATDTVTVSSEATVVSDVTNYHTITQTLPPTTDITTLPVAVITQTADVTNAVNDISTIYTTTTVTHINNNFRRQNGIFLSYAESVISTACSCLVTTPVITKTLQTTVVQTSTHVNTHLATAEVIGTTTVLSTIVDDVTAIVSGATIKVTSTPSPVTVDVTSTATTTIHSTTTDVVVVTDNESYVVAYTGTGEEVYASQYALGTSCPAYLADDRDLDGLVYSPAEFASRCASYCTATSGCVSFAIFTYIPGGGQICVAYKQTYPASSSCLSTYHDYGRLTVYNLQKS